MAKNRKDHSTAIRFAPAIKVLLLCSFLVAAGVGYVWQKDRLVDLGRRLAILEGRLRLLQQQAQQAERNLMGLQSPASLELKVKFFKLGLSRVEPDKVVRLFEPSPTPLTATIGETSIPDRPKDWSPNRGGWVER